MKDLAMRKLMDCLLAKIVRGNLKDINVLRIKYVTLTLIILSYYYIHIWSTFHHLQVSNYLKAVLGLTLEDRHKNS